jgi:CRP-like cAMP-binding protein
MLHRAGRFFRLRSGALTGDELAARVTLLRESEVFRDLGQAETKILATMFDWRALSDGEFLCHEGDEAKEVYLIASGQLDVCVGADKTRVARVERPTVVGEYGLFTNARRNATLVAVGETLVLTLDYARFTRFLLAFPESTLVLLRMVVRQFMQQSKRAAS